MAGMMKDPAFRFRPNPTRIAAGWLALTLIVFASVVAQASPADDAKTVAALDTAYQAAVEKLDVATMDRILADDFVLVLGRGTVITKVELLAETRSGRITYDYQVEEPGTQTVRVWGDTAVVTALLRLKGANNGQAFDRRLWFSDTYVRTSAGWKYVFGQASLPLPQETAK